MSARASCPACGWSSPVYRHPETARRKADEHECRAAHGMTPAELAKWVEQSRKAQGLPPKITDPVVLRKVAVLLGLGDGSR